MKDEIINKKKFTPLDGEDGVSYYKRLMRLRELQLKALVDILKKRNILSEEEATLIMAD